MKPYIEGQQQRVPLTLYIIIYNYYKHSHVIHTMHPTDMNLSHHVTRNKIIMQ